jgi:Disulphide bond corrector protein DsbC
MNKFTAASLFVLFLAVNFHAQTVTGSLDRATVKRGKIVTGKIVLEIPDDLHVNSSIPENEFTIPTTVKLSGNGIRITKLKYPKGIDRKFEFSETPINVYEKRTIINFSFFVPPSFRGKIVKLRAVVGYQPCSTEVCYPPKRQTINLTASVR